MNYQDHWAYINWVLLDEQFNYVSGSANRVGASGVVKVHDNTTIPAIPVTKNGYIFVYCSNESNYDVFFDNLQVIHTQGALLEETHYYPFGLTMAGISSTALKSQYPENKYKFNKGSEIQNKEFTDGSGLEWYATQFRMFDPQIARWHVLDPKPDQMQSLYAAMGNNPISGNDPLGDTLVDQNGKNITYRVNKDGSLKWSKNVTADWKRVGNAMARTKTGLKQLANMAKAKHDVTMKIDNVSKPAGRWGQTQLHGKWNEKTKTFTPTKADVTIYEAKLQDYASAIQQGGRDASGEEQGKLFQTLGSMGDIDGMIGGVGTHEAVHATDKKNVKEQIDNLKLGKSYDLESDPERTETNYLREAVTGIMFGKYLIKAF